MRQYPRVLRPTQHDSPSRRASRKQNYAATYRPHHGAGLSKASSNPASLNTSIPSTSTTSSSTNVGAHALYKKKIGLIKESVSTNNSTSTSLLAGSNSSGIIAASSNAVRQGKVGEKASTTREQHPLKQVQLINTANISNTNGNDMIVMLNNATNNTTAPTTATATTSSTSSGTQVVTRSNSGSQQQQNNFSSSSTTGANKNSSAPYQEPDYKSLSWKEKQNHNLARDYSIDIHNYLKKFQLLHPTSSSLSPHKITHAHRARMVDWMIEVLTNFKCDDMTFFLAVSIMDRYFKEKRPGRELSELHVIGVTSMFLASKMEDIYPLRMSMVFQKIGHKKLPIQTIKNYERDILLSLDYTLNTPTSFDFLRSYLKKMFPKQDIPDRQLIDKMAIYLAKMNLHDYELCTTKKPSLLAVSALYVSLKICEQLRKTHLIDQAFMKRLIKETQFSENEIVDCAQRVLFNAQNFETLFSGLENLKKIHFVNLSTYLKN